MKKTGFGNVRRMLQRLPAAIETHSAAANKESAEDLAAVARVLIPSVSGDSRGDIQTFAAPDGGHVVDFGDKAKVIEGNRGPRPFVNPALRATKDARIKRAKKATRDAIREAASGG